MAESILFDQGTADEAKWYRRGKNWVSGTRLGLLFKVDGEEEGPNKGWVLKGMLVWSLTCLYMHAGRGKQTKRDSLVMQ